MEGLPHLFDFEVEMAHYASLEEEIQELPEVRQVGAILLSTGEYPALNAPVTGIVGSVSSLDYSHGHM